MKMIFWILIFRKKKREPQDLGSDVQRRREREREEERERGEEEKRSMKARALLRSGVSGGHRRSVRNAVATTAATTTTTTCVRTKVGSKARNHLVCFPGPSRGAKSLATRALRAGTVCLFGFGGKANAAKMGSWPPEDNTLPFATFAAGCFWGVELRFQRINGVEKTAVGYIQGQVDNPTYEMICSGMTGHTEAVQMTYDPKVVSFEELCDVFYGGHNATQLNAQGNDVGTQYRSGIYYHTEEQKKIAEEKKGQVAGAVTEIQAADTFWPAEEYHQQYLEKGGRFGSGQSAAKGCTDKIRCYG